MGRDNAIVSFHHDKAMRYYDPTCPPDCLDKKCDKCRKCECYYCIGEDDGCLCRGHMTPRQRDDYFYSLNAMDDRY